MKHFSILAILVLTLLSIQPLSANVDSLKLELLNSDKEIRVEILLKLAKELSYNSEKDAIAYANQAHQLAEEKEDNESVILALTYLGDAYYYSYKLEKALNFYHQALNKSKSIGNHELIGDSFNNIGTVYFLWGEYKLAKQNLHEAVKHYDIAGDKEGLANCYNNLGSIELEQGKVNEANIFYQQTLKLKKESNNFKDVAAALTNIGNVFESKGKNDKALEYYEEALNITREQKDTVNSAHAISNIGLIYQKWGKNQLALSKLKEALNLYKQMKDNKGIANVQTNLGSIYFDLGDFEQSLKYYTRSLDIYGSLKSKSGISSCYYNIAGIYDALDDFNQARIFYEKSLELKLELKDESGIADVFSSLGSIYANLENFDTAYVFYNKALDKKRKLNDTDGMANIYQNIGALMETSGKEDDAIRFYSKALELDRYLKNSLGIAHALQRIGTIYKNRADYAQALFYYKQCMEIAEKGGFNKILMSNYSYLSELYRSTGNYAKALEYQLEYSALRDSLYYSNNQKLIQEHQKVIEELNTRYESDKQKKDIEILEKDRAFQKLWIYTLGIVIFFIAVSFFLLFTRYRVKNKSNALLEQRNKEIELHQQEILDSIFYASRIQTALLPPLHLIESSLYKFFIINRPRDIVSGDFYWVNKYNNSVFIAAADCTGHGIPGAFMSMLGISLLNEVISNTFDPHPGQVLDELRSHIIRSLHQKDDNIVKDGLDISLIRLNIETKTVDFAGAHNPLYIVRDGKLLEYKPDKMPIAIYYKMSNFSTQRISLESGDRLFLFSDGFVDQFGGDKGKKYMKKRFKQLLVDTSNLDIQIQKKAIENAFDDWIGTKEQVDDVLVIGLEI